MIAEVQRIKRPFTSGGGTKAARHGPCLIMHWTSYDDDRPYTELRVDLLDGEQIPAFFTGHIRPGSLGECLALLRPEELERLMCVQFEAGRRQGREERAKELSLALDRMFGRAPCEG